MNIFIKLRNHLLTKWNFVSSTLHHRHRGRPAEYKCAIREIVPPATFLGDGWRRDEDAFVEDYRANWHVEADNDYREISQVLYEAFSPGERAEGAASYGNFCYVKDLDTSAPKVVDLYVHQFLDRQLCQKQAHVFPRLFEQQGYEEIQPGSYVHRPTGTRTLMSFRKEFMIRIVSTTQEAEVTALCLEVERNIDKQKEPSSSNKAL